MVKKVFMVSGMTCGSCEKLIELALGGLDGVRSAKARLADGSVDVEFDENVVGEKTIVEALEKEGYGLAGTGSGRKNFIVLLGAVSIFMGLYLLIESFGGSASFSFGEIDENTSYLLLFGMGLVTGLHCIAMCGGLVLSYSLKQRGGSIFPHVQYGAGKLISYTAIGAFFGFIGSIVAFTIEARAAAGLLAGAFLIVYGLGMLNAIPKVITSRIRLPGVLSDARNELARRGPFATGIATGFFIACGPLQAMYILAAGSGDAFFGGMALFFFGLGTLPVMLGFSYVSSLVSRSFATRITRYSGVLVVLLGLVMVNNSLVLAGTQLAPIDEVGAAQSEVVLATGDSARLSQGEPAEFQVIRMNVTRFGWEPDTFVITKGIPVRWIIDGKEITFCNNEIIVNEYGLDIPIKKGEQTIEFTPEKEGTVSWSCWMGMIPGRFIVVEEEIGQEEKESIIKTQPITTTGSSCSVGGGSCGGGCGCGCSRR